MMCIQKQKSKNRPLPNSTSSSSIAFHYLLNQLTDNLTSGVSKIFQHHPVVSNLKYQGLNLFYMNCIAMVRDRRLFTHLNLKHLILLIGYIYLILIVRLISAFYRFDQLRSRRSIFFCGWSKCDGGFLISAKGSIQ